MAKKADAFFSPVLRSGGPGNWFFDFGKHWFAVLEIEADADKEGEVTLAVGEVLAADGKIDRTPGGSRIYQEETVKLKPGHNRLSMTMFHPGYNKGTLPITPNVAPFRYAEVRGFSGPGRAFQHAYFYDLTMPLRILNAVRRISKASGNSANIP